MLKVGDPASTDPYGTVAVETLLADDLALVPASGSPHHAASSGRAGGTVATACRRPVEPKPSQYRP